MLFLYMPAQARVKPMVIAGGARDYLGVEKFISVMHICLHPVSSMERVATRSESFDKFQHQPGYTRQYTSVYYDRLQQLRGSITPPEAWTQSAKHRERILDLAAGEISWVVGTIARELVHKPNVFEDLKQIYHGNQPKHDMKYCSPQDKVFLEDEYGRILLIGELRTRELLVTGTVVGLLGAQNQLGEFEALDMCIPNLPSEIPRQLSDKPGKVAFISGLSIDEEDGGSAPLLQMLVELISGSSDISRLVICGNSLTAPAEKLIGSRVMRPQANMKALAILDELLATLATLLPVHLMPGKSDPTTVAFPQMPIHPALFRNSKALLQSMALTLETNPQKFTIDDTVLLGTSGQPVDDLMKYTESTVDTDKNLELDLLHRTLKWRHMAPTAPDTLWSYPYSDEDPMVLTELPHVYFSGNASHFASDIRNNVRLICVPSFIKTREVVLLDLKTLDVELVSFQ